jgi:hypothetical protein
MNLISTSCLKLEGLTSRSTEKGCWVRTWDLKEKREKGTSLFNFGGFQLG